MRTKNPAANLHAPLSWVGQDQAELKRIPFDGHRIRLTSSLSWSRHFFLSYTASELLDKVREQNPNINEHSAMVQRNQIAVELACRRSFLYDSGVSFAMYENTDRKFRDYYEIFIQREFPRRKPRQAALAQAQVNVERAQTDLDAQLQTALAEVQKQYVTGQSFRGTVADLSRRTDPASASY